MSALVNAVWSTKIPNDLQALILGAFLTRPSTLTMLSQPVYGLRFLNSPLLRRFFRPVCKSFTHIFSTLWSSSFERGQLWAYKPDLLIGCANVHGGSKQMLKYMLSHEPVFSKLKTFCSLGLAGPCLPQRLGGLRLVPSQLPFDQPILCFFSPVQHPAFNLKSSCLSHRRC